MSDYEYKSPVLKGAEMIKVSRKEHNNIFTKRPQELGMKVEYYFFRESGALEIQYFMTWWLKAFLITVFFIPSLFMQGVPSTLRDVRDTICERSRGKFTSDTFWTFSGETSTKLNELLNRGSHESKNAE